MPQLRAMRGEFAAGHRHKRAAGSFNDLQIADDKAIINGDRAEGLQPIVGVFHQLDADLGDFHAVLLPMRSRLRGLAEVSRRSWPRSRSPNHFPAGGPPRVVRGRHAGKCRSNYCRFRSSGVPDSRRGQTPHANGISSTSASRPPAPVDCAVRGPRHANRREPAPRPWAAHCAGRTAGLHCR